MEKDLFVFSTEPHYIKELMELIRIGNLNNYRNVVFCGI